MRVSWLYMILSVIFLASNCPSVQAGRYALLPRQGTTSSPADSTATAVPGTTSSAISQSSHGQSIISTSGKTAAAASSAKEIGTRSDAISKTSDVPAAASTFDSVTASPIPKGSLNVTTVNATIIEGLPIHPRITPGLSVAGTLMIITGVVYAIIGIKTKWLHISLSSAYLVSLAVTVLIIYVMHSPISDGLQGGLVVAAILPGIVFGALAIVFKDITEGFACFLGGFCLSMWFLVLKPGGLITNDVGKVIFIAFLTAGAFPLYLSHHTRPYGLIGSTSFAGATVIVLGIDCFSRAGLKEFWLYIWSLNSGLFPFHYRQKYPITRAIRVEIAAIIIISLMGIMSQMKVWKIVKQKREERASEQKRKEHERALSDEERGRKVEADNQQDRPLWEALHGGKNKTKVQSGYLDSGIGTEEPSSTRKSSWVREFDAEGIELQQFPDSQKENIGGRVTVHVTEDDFYETSLVGGQRTSMDHMALAAASRVSSHAASESSSQNGTAKGTSKSIDPSLTLQPRVVPPPFRIPDLEPASADAGSSVEAFSPSDHQPDPRPKQISGSLIMRKLSKGSRKGYFASSTSEEALMVPHIDDDQASSLAATHDGISEHGDSEDMLSFSRSQSPIIENILDKASLQDLVAVSHSKVSNMDVVTTPIPESVALPSSRPTSMALGASSDEERSRSTPSSEPSTQSAERIRLSGNLPEGTSKVVTAYRTNEWAKYLDRADIPEVEALKVIKRPPQENSEQDERPAPLDFRALQQTALDAEPAPVKNRTSSSRPTVLPSSTHRSSKNPFSKRSKQQDPPPKLQPVLHPLTIAKNTERNPSQISLANSMSRTTSQTSLNSNGSNIDNHHPLLPKSRTSQSSILPNRGYRSSSTPLGTTPLVESPLEEGVESSFPNTRFTPHNAHLMSQRDRIVSSKPSSTSLLRTSYSNVALDQHPAYRSIQEDSDDLPLAKRKSLLQQNPQTIPTMHRSSSGPSGNTTPRLSSGTSTPLSKNPHRSSSTPKPIAVSPVPLQRNSTISAWRASLKPNTSAQYEDQNMETRRADLLREKQRDSTSRLEGQMRQNVRASVVDQGMRRGDMMSAHQAALRKMQAEAKIS